MIRTRSNYFSALNNLPQPTSLSQCHSSIADDIKKCSSVTEVEYVYASLIKSGDSRDAFITNQFIAASSRFFRMDNAVRAFRQIETSNVFVENAMIRGFVHCGRPYEALDWYVNMLRAEILPTSYTFPPVIRACTSMSASEFGEAVHGHVWRNGFDSHLYVQTSLIDFYSKSNKIGESRKVFDEMPNRDCFAWTAMISAHIRARDVSSAGLLFRMLPERNTAAWNAMIDGYGRSADVESARLLFDQMPSRDVISWTTMIACYSQNKQFKEALTVFKEMIASGVSPDGTTVVTVVSVCAHLGSLELGKEIHLYAMQSGFELDVYMGSALIDMYAKCGALDRSLLVFVKLRDKNLFCWNTMIEGLSAHGYVEETLAMFSRMVKENVEPNRVTFISVLSACTHTGLVEEGRRWFLSMRNDYLIAPEIEHYGCMIDLLSKAGLLEEGLDLIRSMKLKPNSIIWGALLGGCRLHKNFTIGQIAVNELLVLEPDNSGYYHLLVDMYAQENRWDEVKRTWAMMKELGARKNCRGSSWIEMERRIHQFSASDDSHPASAEIYRLSNVLNEQLKLAGYVSEYGSSYEEI